MFVGNYTDNEIAKLLNILPTTMSLSINECGNIKLKHTKSKEVFFNIYYHYGKGFLIRRRLSVKHGIKNVGGILNGGKYLKNWDEVLTYFKQYMERYPRNLYSRVKNVA